MKSDNKLRYNFLQLMWLIILIPQLVFGQMIDNENGDVFSSDDFFNEEFIARNKILKISGEISTKKELARIKNSGKVSCYEFGKLGQLTKKYDTYFRGLSTMDTIMVNFLYDDSSRLITKRRSDNHGFHSYNYVWGSAGNLASERYCRDENIGRSKYEFKLGKQYEITGKSFEIKKLSDTVFKTITFNNYGRKYMEETVYYNSLGYLLKSEKRMIISRRLTSIIYNYNEQGLVSEKIVNQRNSSSPLDRYVYGYDEAGNLTEYDLFKGSKHEWHREVIYDETTFLMKALLSKDMETNLITITKFTYEFYPSLSLQSEEN